MVSAAINEKTSSSSAGEHDPSVAENALDDLRAELEFLKIEIAYINGRVASKNEAATQASRFKELWIPVSSTLVALAGVLSGIMAQYWSTHTQLAANRLEVTFQAKLSSYTGLMLAVDSCLTKAREVKPVTVDGCTSDIKRAYFAIDPFLSKLEGEKVSADIEEIESTLEIAYGSDSSEDKQSLMPHLELLRGRVRKRLQAALFSEVQS